MKFEVQQHKATVRDFNPRKEKDGPDEVSAGDLKVELLMGRDDLAMFAPSLRAFLYDQNDLDVAGEDTNLRFPKLGPLSWSDSLDSAEVVVHYGVGTDLMLEAARVDRFAIHAMTGGSVLVTLRVRFRPNQMQAGLFSTALLHAPISISIAPASGPRTPDGLLPFPGRS